jgi:hypothetical protein
MDEKVKDQATNRYYASILTSLAVPEVKGPLNTENVIDRVCYAHLVYERLQRPRAPTKYNNNRLGRQ